MERTVKLLISVLNSLFCENPAPPLPPEIIEEILLHLISDEGNSSKYRISRNLLSCSLVSKAWLHPARRHLWNGYCFHFLQVHLRPLQELYSSPHYSLALDRIEEFSISPGTSSLGMKTCELRWCGDVLEGVKTMNIEGYSPFYLGQNPMFPPLLLDDCVVTSFSSFRAVTSLKLYRMTFVSPKQFYDLLRALGNRLETLNCHLIDIQHLEQTSGEHISTQLRVLNVDYGTLLPLVRAGGLVLDGLEELQLEDDESFSDDILVRWKAVVQMIAYCRKDLRRLTLGLRRRPSYGASEDLDAKDVRDCFDFSVKAPLLQAVNIQIPSTVQPDYFLTMFSFTTPHKHLSIIEVSGFPSQAKWSEFDQVLERYVPRLEALHFPANSVIQTSKRGYGTLPMSLRMADLVVGTSRWKKATRFLEELNGAMPWCRSRECLCPSCNFWRSLGTFKGHIACDTLDNLEDDISRYTEPFFKFFSVPRTIGIKRKGAIAPPSSNTIFPSIMKHTTEHLISTLNSLSLRQKPVPQLPPEVIEQILLHLISDEGNSLIFRRPSRNLLNCSLVSKAWLHPARRHMWNGYRFYFPQARLKALLTLHSSPHYSLALDRVKQLSVASAGPTTNSMADELRWCGDNILEGVKTITVEGYGKPYPPLQLDDCIINSFSSFRVVTSLKLYRVTFVSPNQFYDLLNALGNGLETLKCTEVRIQHPELLSTGQHVSTRIRALHVDFWAYFSLLHASGMDFARLEELEFDDYTGRNAEGELLVPQSINADNALMGWKGIGQMLARCGKNLRRLVFHRQRYGGALQELESQLFISGFLLLMLIDVFIPGRDIRECFDLSVKAPLVRKILIDLQIAHTTQPDCLLAMFSFTSPHNHLSVIDISGLPSQNNWSDFDRILQRSVPRLKALHFLVRHVIASGYEYAVGTMEIRRHLGYLRVGGDSWNKARQFLDVLEEAMPWCRSRECLCPSFVYALPYSQSRLRTRYSSCSVHESFLS
ncbi:hypothetical protein VNI00_004254 [Paramarasmius palmivorus]|uniref:F-box domain-containing protein n=1 Tax=Paramarasmius palmivorus TaxID=297713 RepID=A0AAW0DN05_9AGAR